MVQCFRQYFHKAICQSGSSLHEWLIQKDPIGKSMKMAQLLGFKGGSQIDALGNGSTKCRSCVVL